MSKTKTERECIEAIYFFSIGRPNAALPEEMEVLRDAIATLIGKYGWHPSGVKGEKAFCLSDPMEGKHLETFEKWFWEVENAYIWIAYHNILPNRNGFFEIKFKAPNKDWILDDVDFRIEYDTYCDWGQK